MAVEQIRETDTLNVGRIKINNILDAANAASEKVDSYQTQLNTGIDEAKKIASDKGDEAVRIATEAGNQANVTANEAKGIAQNANTKSDQAVSTANQNKQEFDQLRNDFDDLVAEAGDSNPEIVQARTDTEGIKQTTLANRLTADFSSRMSKADGIELISGQTIVNKMMDYQGKTAGNTSTNPHVYYSDFTANTLKKPSAAWNEISQADYNKLASRDDSGVSTGSTANGVIPQQMSVIDNVETARRLSSQLFESLSDEEAVQFVKDKFVGFTTAVRAKVSAPNNKNLKVAVYMPATDSWNTISQQDATDFTDFTIQINDNQYIDSVGKTYLLYYSDQANGVTASNVTVDYSGTQIRLSLSAQDILEKSGFAKQENVASKEELSSHIGNQNNPHGTTKAQIGLSEVQNYGIATIEEAQVADSNTKFMTPLRTIQTLESFIPKMSERFQYGTHYIAHRGNHMYAPENSKPAFRMVNSHWGCETDVQVTSDGYWVVMHDETVDRTTNGTGNVKNMTLAQIKALNIDAGNHVAKYSGDDLKVPTMEEYLIILRDTGVVPVIEIKDAAYTSANYDSFVKLLQRFGLENKALVISYSSTALAEVKKRLPYIPVSYLVNDITDQSIETAKALGCFSGINVNYASTTVTLTNVEKCRVAGLSIAAYTAPDSKFKDIVTLGFDFITTDSLSGNLKVGSPTLLNGFTFRESAALYSNQIRELGNGMIAVNLTVDGGPLETRPELATLPDWAVPTLTTWQSSSIRTSSGIQYATVDVNGRAAGTSAGKLVPNFWSARSTWATMSFIYPI